MISENDNPILELRFGDMKIKSERKFNYVISVVKGEGKLDTEIRKHTG